VARSTTTHPINLRSTKSEEDPGIESYRQKGREVSNALGRSPNSARVDRWPRRHSKIPGKVVIESPRLGQWKPVRRNCAAK